jgi:hypothetical protein
MKKIVLLLVAASGLMAGCVVDDGSYRSGYYDDGRGTYRSGYYDDGRSRDRDGDGVSNRNDRRPDNPYRY